MAKKFEIHYSLAGSVVVEAETELEAKAMFLNSDHIETEQLLDGAKLNIGESGNDAIQVLDVFPAEN
ncbi:hypothetical protein JMA_39220 (plasmid) [Jeotgalibacillus malaysiensis]|uniref:Uncharacterized protein n=1 Tax=Jeotgalibacillus malaysiensis TaxID=1508404 RepID=A0A0B5ASQ5_9BACL|nr:hypothetical protein [Jeotgalibacillus malaysiensis]AJD93240.1 hypothetical protein JMA_39220 [Jeotgalibacillus malaysiensis]